METEAATEARPLDRPYRMPLYCLEMSCGRETGELQLVRVCRASAASSRQLSARQQAVCGSLLPSPVVQTPCFRRTKHTPCPPPRLPDGWSHSRRLRSRRGRPRQSQVPLHRSLSPRCPGPAVFGKGRRTGWLYGGLVHALTSAHNSSLCSDAWQTTSPWPQPRQAPLRLHTYSTYL
jgi:hypothetical protein